MARRLIKDTCQIAAEIIDGEHDDDLDYILQAVKSRQKTRFRKGSRVRIVGSKDIRTEGKEGVVLKVNQKSVSVGLGEKIVHGDGTEFSFHDYADGEWNFSPSLLEVI